MPSNLVNECIQEADLDGRGESGGVFLIVVRLLDVAQLRSLLRGEPPIRVRAEVVRLIVHNLRPSRTALIHSFTHSLHRTGLSLSLTQLLMAQVHKCTVINIYKS